jgi:uncharacterized protein Yka (UPF0111/DUF47 family)
MSLSFFPKTVKFYDLFMVQNRKLVKAVGILDAIFREFTDVEEKCKQINIIEYDGNKISRTIAIELSQTFITPIDREDIHEINIRQEATLNIIKAISNRVGVYDFTELKYPAKKVISNLKAMVEEAGAILECLSKRNSADACIARTKSLKYECEMLLLVGLGEIYDSHGLNLIGTLEILKWTHIYDRIEQAVEGVEVLCEVLEGILLKYA